MVPQTFLVATPGGQPQVVTFALDALLAQREAIQAAPPLEALRTSNELLDHRFLRARFAGFFGARGGVVAQGRGGGSEGVMNFFRGFTEVFGRYLCYGRGRESAPVYKEQT